MRIFVSWSGDDSRRVAELLREWLPGVIQGLDLYVSSQDIEKGERWSASVTSTLEAVSFGLIALTKRNVTAPWVLFEAGALSKSVGSRLVPILCNVSDADLTKNPLSQFQYVRVNRKEFFMLVEAINSASERALSPSLLKRTFDLWWPDFEAKFSEIEFEEPDKTEAGPEDRLAKIEGAVNELLHTTRILRKQDRPQYVDLRPDLERIAKIYAPTQEGALSRFKRSLEEGDTPEVNKWAKAAFLEQLLEERAPSRVAGRKKDVKK